MRLAILPCCDWQRSLQTNHGCSPQDFLQGSNQGAWGRKSEAVQGRSPVGFWGLAAKANGILLTRQLSYRKEDRAMRPTWVPWKVLRVLTTHPATFPEICNGLLFRSILRMCVQKLKFVALPVPEIIGGTQKIWAVPGYAHAPFSPKNLKGFCLDGPCEHTCQIWSS